MISRRSSIAFGLVSALGLYACSPSEPAADKAAAPPTAATEAPPAAAAAAPPPLPATDLENARQFVQEGDALEELTFDRSGSTTVKGIVKGDAAPVYAVPVSQGQTLTVTFAPSNSNLYVNVSDAADHSGAALHRGEVDGNAATLKAERDMTFVITPFQPRATARRNEAGEYSITVARD